MEKLSDCEEEVFLSVFFVGEVRKNTINDYLNKMYDHNWKSQTISTFIERLKKKGYLTVKQKGRYAYYEPNISLKEYRMQKIQKMAQILFEGNIEDFKNFLDEYSKNE